MGVVISSTVLEKIKLLDTKQYPILLHGSKTDELEEAIFVDSQEACTYDMFNEFITNGKKNIPKLVIDTVAGNMDTFLSEKSKTMIDGIGMSQMTDAAEDDMCDNIWKNVQSKTNEVLHNPQISADDKKQFECRFDEMVSKYYDNLNSKKPTGNEDSKQDADDNDTNRPLELCARAGSSLKRTRGTMSLDCHKKKK